MVRAYIVQTGTPPGMLAAIADKPIGSALQLMHQSPQEPWSLESLSRRVGMSRSAFAARFNQLVGQTPMHYLTFWRMQKARASGRIPAQHRRDRRTGGLSVGGGLQQGFQENRRRRTGRLSA